MGLRAPGSSASSSPEKIEELRRQLAHASASRERSTRRANAIMADAIAAGVEAAPSGYSQLAARRQGSASSYAGTYDGRVATWSSERGGTPRRSEPGTPPITFARSFPYERMDPGAPASSPPTPSPSVRGGALPKRSPKPKGRKPAPRVGPAAAAGAARKPRRSAAPSPSPSVASSASVATTASVASDVFRKERQNFTGAYGLAPQSVDRADERLRAQISRAGQEQAERESSAEAGRTLLASSLKGFGEAAREVEDAHVSVGGSMEFGRSTGVVTLRHPSGGSATILSDTAQVISWRDADGGERFFRSEVSRMQPGSEVRGGVGLQVSRDLTDGPNTDRLFRTWQAAVPDCDWRLLAADLPIGAVDPSATLAGRFLDGSDAEVELVITLRAGALDMDVSCAEELAASFVSHVATASGQEVELAPTFAELDTDDADDLLRFCAGDDSLDVYYSGVARGVGYGMDCAGRGFVVETSSSEAGLLLWNPGAENAEHVSELGVYGEQLFVGLAVVANSEESSATADWRSSLRLSLASARLSLTRVLLVESALVLGPAALADAAPVLARLAHAFALVLLDLDAGLADTARRSRELGWRPDAVLAADLLPAEPADAYEAAARLFEGEGGVMLVSASGERCCAAMAAGLSCAVLGADAGSDDVPADLVAATFTELLSKFGPSVK